MSSNIDVQFHEDGSCVTAYATNLLTGEQASGISCSGNPSQKRANAAKAAIDKLPKPSTSTSSSYSSNPSQSTTYSTEKPRLLREPEIITPSPMKEKVKKGFVDFSKFNCAESLLCSNYIIYANNGYQNNHQYSILYSIKNEFKPYQAYFVLSLDKITGLVISVKLEVDFNNKSFSDYHRDTIKANIQTDLKPQEIVFEVQQKLLDQALSQLNINLKQKPKSNPKPTKQPATKKASAYENYAGIIKFGSLVVYGIGLFGSFGSWVALLNFGFFGTIALVIALAVSESLPRE